MLKKFVCKLVIIFTEECHISVGVVVVLVHRNISVCAQQSNGLFRINPRFLHF